MKKLFILGCFIPIWCFGWFPSKGGQEFRIIGTTYLENIKEYHLEGALLSHTQHGNISFSGHYSMNIKKEKGTDDTTAKLGGMIGYKINKYVTISYLADLSHIGSLGHNFYMHVDINTSAVEVMPFVSVNHEKLGEVGFVAYLVDFPLHLGVSYTPHEKHLGLGIGDKKGDKLKVLLGTTIEFSNFMNMLGVEDKSKEIDEKLEELEKNNPVEEVKYLESDGNNQIHLNLHPDTEVHIHN